jgi:hypothetical protein
VLVSSLRIAYEEEMQWRVLASFGVGATLGYNGHGTTRSDPQCTIQAPQVPVPVTACPTRPAGSPVAIAVPVAVDEPRAADDTSPEPELEPVPDAAERGELLGHVSDPRDGSALAGVTIVASSVVGPDISVITDEHGDWKLGGLAPARYQLRFFYANEQFDRDVGVSSIGPTRLDVAFDPDSEPPSLHADDDGYYYDLEQ